jgi:hypothetical protein
MLRESPLIADYKKNVPSRAARAIGARNNLRKGRTDGQSSGADYAGLDKVARDARVELVWSEESFEIMGQIKD